VTDTGAWQGNEALLTAVSGIRPELTAFFGCLYYAALRPEEATGLRAADCDLPATCWRKLTLTRTAPRSGAAWTRERHQPRATRPQAAPRARHPRVTIPPALVTLLRRHHDRHGTPGDGRLLSESTYGRVWQQARALGPATAASGLARRPYGLRHAALSLWLNVGARPDRRPRGHSVIVLLSTYAHCIGGQHEIANRQIERALNTQNRRSNRTTSGAADRRSRPDPVRHMSASGSHRVPRPSRRPLCTSRTWASTRPAGARVSAAQRPITGQPKSRRIWPTHGPQNTADGLRNRSSSASPALTHFSRQAADLRKHELEWWQVLGSNQRRLSRRFYRGHPHRG
jgi:hypothetical protein